MTPEQQRTAALKVANERRLGRAAIRRDLSGLSYSEGCARAAELIGSGDQLVEGMKLSYLLGGVCRFGPVKVRRLASVTGVPRTRFDRRIGHLSERERASIAGVLQGLARCENPKERWRSVA